MRAGIFILAIIGVGLLAYGLFPFWRQRQIAAFQHMPAEFIECSVVNKLDSARSYHKRWFAVKVRYRYRIGGVIYESTRVGLDTRSSWFSESSSASRFVQTLQARATCLNDARQPKWSVLVDRLPAHRRAHYFASIVAGLQICAIVMLLAQIGE